jgi:hypothetical protein
MKLPRLSRVLGVAAMLCGAWWLWAVAIEPFTSGRVTKAEDFLFALAIIPMMAVPGVSAGLFGYQVTRSSEPRYIKRVLGTFAAFAVLLISGSVNGLVKWPRAEELKDGCFVLLSTLIVILIYLKTAAWVLRREGTPVESVTALISKTIVGIVAFEFYWVMRSGAEAFTPVKSGYKYVHEEPWGMIGMLAPIFVAWLSYKIAIRSLNLQSPRESQHRSFRLTR